MQDFKLLVSRLFAASIGGIVGIVTGSLTAIVIGGVLADAFHAGDAAVSIVESCKWIGMVVGGVGGALLGTFLAGHPVVARWCLGTAFVVGGVSFLFGFVGPIILAPNSPQGPLLGILITGPIGFAAGIVIGLFVGLWKERHAGPITPSFFRLSGN